MHSGCNNSINQSNYSTLKRRKIEEESAITFTVTMTGTDKAPSGEESCLSFTVKDINRYPLPGCFEPSSVAFSPDDKLISYLYSPDNTLNRDIFAFDPSSRKKQMLLSLPGGGFDESVLSNEEKLWRERFREHGLGITCYEWVKSSQSPRIMVPLPNGVAETRFASHTIVMRRLLKVKDALSQMVIGHQWGVWKISNSERAQRIRDLILNESWWARVAYVLNFTEPIMTMLCFADIDTPCLGDVYDGMDTMVEKVKHSIQAHESDPTQCEALCKQVQAIINHRWNKMTTPLHLLAYALSPRYYSEEIADMPGRVAPFADEEVAEGCHKALSRLFPLEEIHEKVREEFGLFASGLKHSPFALKDQNRLGAITWWYMYGQPFKHLQPLAIKVLSQIYFLDAPSSELRLRLPRTSWSPIINPQLSPDGTMIAFVRDDEICVMSLSHGKPKQITNGARGHRKRHGLAEYIAQEEMERKNGFWWSADSSYIAFTQVDTTEIPIFQIMHQGKATIGANARDDHHYPFAGNANAKVRLGVAPAFGGGITWMDVNCGIKGKGNDDEEYLARVSWMPENVLIAQVLNRAHSRLKLLKFDIRSGKREVLLVEENDIWINLHDCFAPLNKGIDRFAGSFIWASERSGFRHLYLYDQMGTFLGPITEGNWMVDQLIGVNEHMSLVYFIGTVDSPLETNLYSTKLFPDWRFPLQKPKRLTQGRGSHVVILDHQMKRFVDIHHSLCSPPRVWLCSLEDGSLLMPIYEQPVPTPHARSWKLSPPDLVQIVARDGTVLYGALYKPDINRFGPPPYRTMISVYGGPNVQIVYDSWTNTVDMRAQYLRSKGILVWKLDNRGSARRGLKFEGVLKYNLGLTDIEDQETGATWLIEQGLAKRGRIGLYGWSYGGYLAAMAMGRCPDTFKCAIAGAPVTAWDGYDTFYTEKYMGMPSYNPAGYEYSSVMHHVHGIKGKLLLVHGMIDENVHFRHTARLVNALIAAGKTHELLLFPDERHTVRQYRMYLEERIWEFIDRNL